MAKLPMIQTFDDAVVIVSRDGVVLHVNEHFQDWLGEGPIEVRPGSSIWSAVAPERVSQRKIVLAHVLASGESSRFVDQIRGRWTQVLMHPVSTEPQDQQVAFIYRDIDDQVRAEEEVKRLRLRVLTIQEEERRAISQNLHDELGQGMTALLMQLRSLAHVASSSPELAAGIREVTTHVETLTKRMRQIFYRIRPPALRNTELVQALADYCAATAHASGLRIDFDADEAIPDLDGEESTALYRALQESLNNTIKHAGAESAWVTLGLEGSSMYLSVEDDGRGFDALVVRPGLGLSGLKERFEMVAGDVQVDSRPGGGTRITASVPVGASLSTLS